MLRNDVIEAVIAGKFHIYPVATVEQGIAILTGVKAGARESAAAGNGKSATKSDSAEAKQAVVSRNGDGAGAFEPDTVFALVDKRLHEWAHALKDFG